MGRGHKTGAARKIAATAAPILFAAAVGLPSNALAKHRYFLEGTFFSGWSGNPVASVTRMPESVRHVPIHPDDGGAKNVPIDDKPLQLYGALKLTCIRSGLLFSSASGGIALAFGAELATMRALQGNGFTDRKDFAEANYGRGGDPVRGYGTALTYYLIKSGDDLVHARFSLLTELRARPAKETSVGVGIELYPLPVKAEQGWDRYNALEPRKDFDLATLLIGGVYATGRQTVYRGDLDRRVYVAADCGAQNILGRRSTDLGRQVEIEGRWAWFFDVRAGWEF